MVRINDNFIKLPSSYLFSEVARKVKVFMEAHPEAEVISEEDHCYCSTGRSG